MPELTQPWALRNGGEMGALIRAFDWSQTPLGPLQEWPQHLRTAVALLLECKLPMYLALGVDRIQIYNDAYRPILGADKHPGALGTSARDTWAEIWPTIGPMWEQVWRGESIGFDDFRLVIEHDGRQRDSYFNFSYSPYRDTLVLPPSLLRDDAPTPPSPPLDEAPPAGGQRSILIVDDNRDAADTLGMLLEMEGHRVAVAYGGEEALELAQRLRPEVAILDIGMPGMDGYQLAARLRASTAAPPPVLIAATGWGQPQDQQRALQAGFDRHLTKPLEPARIVALLAELELPG